MMHTHELTSDLPDISDLSVTPISGVTRVQIWRHTLPHALPVPSLIWFIRGNARVILAGRAIGISPNACMILPAGTPFALDPGAQMQASLLQMPQTPLLPQPDRAQVLRLSDIATQGELSGLLDRIGSGLAQGGPGSERAAIARAMLVSAFLERLQAHVPPAPPLTAPQRLAARFTEEVEQCYATGATLNDIGAVLEVSPTHLTRTLKATCGITAAQYLTERLMHAARCELVDTSNSAAEIARDLGFSSAAYFSRAFLHNVGETPGRFRARARSGPMPAGRLPTTASRFQSA